MDHAERNLSLFADREKGMTYRELSQKYSVSLERAREIYIHTGRLKRFEGNDLYALFMSIDPDHEGIMRHSFLALYRVGITDIASLKEYLNDGGDLKRIRNIGEKSEQAIMEAIERIA